MWAFFLFVPQIVMPRPKRDPEADTPESGAEAPEETGVDTGAETPENTEAPEPKPEQPKKAAKGKVESGSVMLENPKGRKVSVPESDVERLLAAGFKKA